MAQIQPLLARYPRLVTSRCRFLSQLVKGKSVLDLGCVEHDLTNRARGQWLHEHLRTSSAEILGVDYEVAAIRQMSEEGYRVVAGDVTDLNLGTTFDIVMAGELIEHVSNAKGFIESARRHLRPDGHLVLTTPNANCLVYFLENLIFGREIDNPDHVAIYSPTTIRALLQRFSLTVEAIVFLAENTAYCHKQLISQTLVHLKQAAQLSLGWIRPSICHHMVVIARLAP